MSTLAVSTQTRGDTGYVVIDIEANYSEAVLDRLSAIPGRFAAEFCSNLCPVKFPKFTR